MAAAEKREEKRRGGRPHQIRLWKTPRRLNHLRVGVPPWSSCRLGSSTSTTPRKRGGGERPPQQHARLPLFSPPSGKPSLSPERDDGRRGGGGGVPRRGVASAHGLGAWSDPSPMAKAQQERSSGSGVAVSGGKQTPAAAVDVE